MIKKIFKSHYLLIIGVILGGLGGYLYWRYVGCASGACPITSKPLNSSIYGAVLGGLLVSSFKKQKKSEKENNKSI